MTDQTFMMKDPGLCGAIKQTEVVTIREVDAHGVATVLCGSRVDMTPFDALHLIRKEEPHA